ncbi:MAG: PKD domain-containing protein [Flavobacteriaceae bacterium]
MKFPKLYAVCLVVLNGLILFPFQGFSQVSPNISFESDFGTASTISVCPNSNVTFKVLNFPEGATFKFYKIPQGGASVQISLSLTESELTTSDFSQGDRFFAEVFYPTASGMTTFSTPNITINLLTAPSVTITSNITSDYYCSGTSLIFSASGADLYAFYINDILQQASSTVATFESDKLHSTAIVTVIGYNTLQCSAVASITVQEVDLSPGRISGNQIVDSNGIISPLVSEEEAKLSDQSFDSGNIGVYQWESSTDGTQWHEILNANQASFSPTLIVENTFFRRKAMGLATGNICLVYTDPVLIQFNPRDTIDCDEALQVSLQSYLPYQSCDNRKGVAVIGISGGAPPYSIQWEKRIDSDHWTVLPNYEDQLIATDLDAGIYRTVVSSNISSSTSCLVSGTSTDIIIREETLEMLNFSLSQDCSAEVNIENSGVLEFDFINTLSTTSSKRSSVTFKLNGSPLIPDNNLFVVNGGHYTLKGISPGGYALEVSTPDGTCNDIYSFTYQINPIYFYGKLNYEVDSCKGYATISVSNSDIKGGVPLMAEGQPFYSLTWVYTPADPDLVTATRTFNGYTLERAYPGEYQLLITDSTDCGGQTGEEIIIRVNDSKVDPFVISGSLIDPRGNRVKVLANECIEDPDKVGKIGIDIAGGIKPLEIKWFYRLSELNSFSPLSSFDNLLFLNDIPAGEYKVEINSLSAQCRPSDDLYDNFHYEEIITLNVKQSKFSSPPVYSNKLCQQGVGEMLVEVSQQSSSLLFYIDNQLLRVLDITADGRRYTLEVASPLSSSMLQLRNLNDCLLDEIPIDIRLETPIFSYSSISSELSAVIPVRELVYFSNDSPGQYDKVRWSFGDGETSDIIEYTDSESKMISHAYLLAGNYRVILEIFNSSGCSKISSQTITIGDGYHVIVPNAFTPNQDNINDVFRPIVSGFSTINFAVYEITGNLLYLEEKSDTDPPRGIFFDGWNGQNASNLSRNFIYTLNGTLLDKTTKIERSGTFISLK